MEDYDDTNIIIDPGVNTLESNPDIIAKNLSNKYDIEVISAKDDMILEL